MFDLSTVKSSGADEELLPEGRYNVICSSAVMKDTKAGTGKFIAAVFTIKTGQYKGRQIKENFNVDNPNPTAVKIGRETLKEFFENSSYAGDFKFETADDAVVEMMGLSSVVDTKIQASKNPEFGPSVKVKKYNKVSAAIPASRVSAPAAEEQIPF